MCKKFKTVGLHNVKRKKNLDLLLYLLVVEYSIFLILDLTWLNNYELKFAMSLMNMEFIARVIFLKKSLMLVFSSYLPVI